MEPGHTEAAGSHNLAMTCDLLVEKLNSRQRDMGAQGPRWCEVHVQQQRALNGEVARVLAAGNGVDVCHLRARHDGVLLDRPISPRAWCRR